MKKKGQPEINKICEHIYNLAMSQFGQHHRYIGRLPRYNADIYMTEDFYILFSYENPVAVLDCKDGSCYNFLDYYISTTSEHIKKFFSEYCTTNYHTYRWYPVKTDR